MKGKAFFIAILVFFTSFLVFIPIIHPKETEKPSWEVYFSPNGGCTNAIIRELSNSKNSVLVQAYSFTSSPIAKALLSAHKRGVKVKVLLDKSHLSDKYSEADILVNSGIITKIDNAHAIAHNKIVIIDEEIVITGSFNFTKAAEKNNAENLLVIRDKKLASLYKNNWQLHEQYSVSYIRKSK